MLPRKHRIESSLFPAVTRGAVLQNDLFRVVLKRDSTLTHPKCAVIVPNKVAKTAVLRNRVRRQVYAALGEMLNSLPNAYISIFPKGSSLEYGQLVEGLKDLLCSKI